MPETMTYIVSPSSPSAIRRVPLGMLRIFETFATVRSSLREHSENNRVLASAPEIPVTAAVLPA